MWLQEEDLRDLRLQLKMQRKARKAAERWLRMELKSRVRLGLCKQPGDCACQRRPNATAAWSQRVHDELGWVAQMFEQQTLDDTALTCLNAGEDAGACMKSLCRA